MTKTVTAYSTFTINTVQSSENLFIITAVAFLKTYDDELTILNVR